MTYKFQLGWEDYLVSSKNYIVAYADGRGGAGRGQKWLHANYKNLGSYEVTDAITAGRLATELLLSIINVPLIIKLAII